LPTWRRVLFLVAGREEPSCRFRVLQYLPYLREQGCTADVADLSTDLAARWRILRAAAVYDRVVVHRAFLGRLEVRWLNRRGPGYVFDFDDAISMRDSAAPRRRSLQRRVRFARMARHARAVIAGNDYLAALARPHQARVAVVPTAIDLRDYPRRAAEPSAPIVGWMGSRSNLPYLRALLPVFAAAHRRDARLRLVVVSDGTLGAAAPFVVERPWSRARELADLHSFQIGIMPLADDEWTRGKCGLKLLQYGAAALPMICSPVGVNAQIVRHGVNGLLAATPEEWARHVGALLADAPLRHRLGAAARHAVAEKYSLAVIAPRFLRALAETAAL
jgi:glycosyltransferase involved in cell wall biosynthesis